MPQLYKKIRNVKALVGDDNPSSNLPPLVLPAVVMVGNKLDRSHERKVSREEAEKEAKCLNWGYTEVTANGKVEDMFFKVIECSKSSSFCNRTSEDGKNGWFCGLF